MGIIYYRKVVGYNFWPSAILQIILIFPANLQNGSKRGIESKFDYSIY